MPRPIAEASWEELAQRQLLYSISEAVDAEGEVFWRGTMRKRLRFLPEQLKLRELRSYLSALDGVTQPKTMSLETLEQHRRLRRIRVAVYARAYIVRASGEGKRGGLP